MQVEVPPDHVEAIPPPKCPVCHDLRPDIPLERCQLCKGTKGEHHQLHVCDPCREVLWKDAHNKPLTGKLEVHLRIHPGLRRFLILRRETRRQAAACAATLESERERLRRLADDEERVKRHRASFGRKREELLQPLVEGGASVFSRNSRLLSSLDSGKGPQKRDRIVREGAVDG